MDKVRSKHIHCGMFESQYNVCVCTDIFVPEHFKLVKWPDNHANITPYVVNKVISVQDHIATTVIGTPFDTVSTIARVHFIYMCLGWALQEARLYVCVWVCSRDPRISYLARQHATLHLIHSDALRLMTVDLVESDLMWPH